MSVEVGGAAKLVLIVIGIFGAVWGSVEVADSRYELQAVHEIEHTVIQTSMDTLSYTALKREIREIRTLISQEQNPQRIVNLKLDLSDAIDRLCREFPADRECK